jgi:hypothetical protein
MKYKVGDKVKIREDLKVNKMYGDWDCSEDMAQCGGKIATIVRCCDDFYKIDLEDNFYNWTDEMFEEEHKHISKFNIGDKVRVRRDLEVGKEYNRLTLTKGMYACHHGIMTIESADDDNYTCIESCYWWGEDMLEKVEETEDNTKMTVEDLLNKTDVEVGGLIITVYYPNAYFEATIGHNKINRNSELYKRFIKAYGDMIVDEVSFDIRNDNMVVMLIKVDYAD